MPGSKRLARLLSAAALVASSASGRSQSGVEKDIAGAVIRQFDQSDAVALTELHGSQADQDLRIQIVRNKEFAKKVHIIVVEGLNALYQDDLDRYIGGEAVPRERIQRVWRDTTGIFVGPVILTAYERFLSEVRSVNRTLPDRFTLRVIAADPPLDWGHVASSAEFRSILGKRADFGAEVIEREVLRKRQKALLIFATAWFTRNKQHMTKGSLAPWTDTIGAKLDLDFPGRIYVIAPVRSGVYPSTSKLEQLIGAPASPVLLRLKGTIFGTLDANEFITANSAVLLGAPDPPYRSYRDGTRLAEVADACIYRGRAQDALVPADPSYAGDAAYQAELKRRAALAP
jgi:hypothetical protein